MKTKRRFFLLFSMKMAFVSFSWLIVLVKTCIIILNRRGKSKHSCLVPDFRGKNSIFFWKDLILFWLHWVFIAARGLSPVAARGVYSMWCTGFSLQWFPCCGIRALGHEGFRSCDLLTLRLSCPKARGIFPDRVSHPCSLHWKANS